MEYFIKPKFAQVELTMEHEKSEGKLEMTWEPASLFICASCRNTVFAFEHYTGADGQKGACKEAIDTCRYFYQAGCHEMLVSIGEGGEVESGEWRVESGGWRVAEGAGGGEVESGGWRVEGAEGAIVRVGGRWGEQ